MMKSLAGRYPFSRFMASPSRAKATEVLRCRELTRCANSVLTCRNKKAPLFDHLVGKCEQRVRYVELHRLCGFQIEHEQEARRLLDRQVGGFSAFEDAIDQGGRTLENLTPVRSIRHQAAFTS